jgi:hypothetical protein
LTQPLAVTNLVEARGGLAARNGGPSLPGNDRLSAIQTRSRRPIDDLVGDPMIDAAALGLKGRDDLGLGAPEEIDEVWRWIIGPYDQRVAGGVKSHLEAHGGGLGEDFGRRHISNPFGPLCNFGECDLSEVGTSFGFGELADPLDKSGC